MGASYVRCRLAQWLSLCLGPRLAFACAERLADAQWRCAPEVRAAVQANLSAIHGAPVRADAALVREVFRNFGRYLVEFLTIHRVPSPAVQVEGADELRALSRGGRGLILLAAHIGNWELGAIVLSRMGFPVTVVALPHRDPRLDRLFNAQRRRCGVEVIPLGRHAARWSLQRLREGHLLGILGDREFGHNGVGLSLCGAQVTLPRGPAVLSLRSQAPIVPTFLIREGPWRFRLRMEPPLWPAAQTIHDGSVQAMTRAYAVVLERYLKQFPDQWLMFQPVMAVSPLKVKGER